MTAVFKRDLANYFVTPLGYVYIAAFTLGTSIYFILTNVTNSFSDLGGVFSFILLVLMITTPLLTMSLLSEEYKQKTDQLLLTAPVRVIDIIMGKFAAAFSVYLIALALTLLCPLTVAIAGNLAIVSVIGNYTALICAGAAFISIGLFMSSLTQTQLVAALSSLGAMLIIYFADWATSAAASGFAKFISDVVGSLSLFRRYELFARGIFSVADLFFYLSVCAFFLFLAARCLEKKRWS